MASATRQVRADDAVLELAAPGAAGFGMAQAKQATQDPKKRRARMRDESWKAIPGYEG